MINGSTGQIVFQSTDSSRVFTNVVRNCSAGNTINVEKGTYMATTTWTMNNLNSVTLHFDDGALLTVANGLNAPAICLDNCNNCVISGITVDGNAANQNVNSPPVGPYGGMYGTIDGVLIMSSNNCYVTGANIYNCRQFGFYTFLFSGTSNNNVGIVNSIITNCGWNGITLGWDGAEYGLYATGNDVSYCSDVGISAQGSSCSIRDNYVHDITTNTGSNSAHWGLAEEGGSGSIFSGNVVARCSIGLEAAAPSVTFIGGSVSDCTYCCQSYASGSSAVFRNIQVSNYAYRAFQISGANNIIENCNIMNADPAPYLQAIEIFGGNNARVSNCILQNSGGNTAIQVDNGAGNVVIQTNQVLGGFVYGIVISSGSEGTTVTGNSLSGCTTLWNGVQLSITDSGTATKITANTGYNPVGDIATPIYSGTSVKAIVDSPSPYGLGNSATWQSGVTYTNWGSPKVLYITGGTVSAVVQNGVTRFTTTGCTITLQPDDTFSVTFSATPTIRVTGQ